MKSIWVEDATFAVWGKDWWNMLKVTLRMSGMDPDAFFSTSLEAKGGVTYSQDEDCGEKMVVELEVDGAIWTSADGEKKASAAARAAGFSVDTSVQSIVNPISRSVVLRQRKPAVTRSYDPAIYAKRMLNRFYQSRIYATITV